MEWSNKTYELAGGEATARRYLPVFPPRLRTRDGSTSFPIRPTQPDMLRQPVGEYVWVTLVLVLGMWSLGTEARAQFRSTERASRLDTLRSLAPAPLAESRSLDGYVRDATTLRPRRRLDAPDRYEFTLGRGQELLLGGIGLVVQAFCDGEGEKPMTVRPDFALEPGERACIHCDRVEDRAWDAVWGRSPSSTP